MELKYNGVTLPASMVQELVDYAKKLNVPASYLITKLHFEGVWGTSNVARAENNWAGMTWTGDPQRPSGIIVSKGGARPANEGGHYMRYKSVDEFLIDWTHLIRAGGSYKVANSSSFEEAVKGMFVYGGAKYDYATMNVDSSKERYELYLAGMEARREAINKANDGALDTLDKGEVNMSVTAEKVLNEARKLIGVTKYSAGHKRLIDDYNKVSPRPVGYAVNTSDDWCDAFVTVVSDRAGATSLIGRECGVERHKNIFKQKNIWLGLAKPQAGDIIIFRWDGNRTGFAHHIGLVEKVSGNTITTIEGNTTKNGVSVVGRNTFAWNDKNIQGYARPKYGTPSSTSSSTSDKKVSQHLVVTVESLRAFDKPSSAGKMVETIKKDLVKNIDLTTEAEGYLWGGWISSADGKRRWTTLETLDGKRKFVDIKAGTIGHGGKTYTEYLDTQKVVEVKPTQPAGGDEPKLADNEVLLDGVVYVIQKK